MKPRLVIDPNVIASVLLGGLTKERYGWLLSNLVRFDICYSATVIEEVMALPEVPFFKKKKITVRKVEEFVKDFQAYSIKILVTSNVRLGRDRNDFYLLGLARDARAQYLITGDPDLLEIREYGKTKIITLREFVEMKG